MRLPACLQRALLLRRARRHLTQGDIEATLATLADPRLALALDARTVREAALEYAARAAGRAAAQGPAADLERWMRLLAAEDPGRAARFAVDSKPAANGAASPAPLARLLAEMRARTQGAVPAGFIADVPAGTAAGSPASASATRRSASSPMTAFDHAPDAGVAVQRFHIAIDDGGEWLVTCAPSVTLGHLRSPRADLPFLADVEAEHARIFRDESFHAGASWQIAPIGTGGTGSAGVVQVGGRVLAGAEVLYDGDEVRLAPNLAFRFRTPDPASATSLLELSAGAECEGVRRILLFANGEAGRVRIGARGRHIAIADIAHEVVLVLRGRELVVRCAGGVGLFEAGAPPETAVELAIACPPRGVVQLRLGARAVDRPPFSLTLMPSDPPPRTAR